MKKYQRQLAIPGFTLDKQQQLMESALLVVGAGGLAATCLLHLCGAGVGSLFIADGDVVEESNLHRQVIFREEDLGRNKAECAVQRLETLNSEVTLNALPFFLNKENEEQIPLNLQLIIDCTDRIQTKYFLNDYCSEKNIPFISASNFQWEGQLFILSNKMKHKNLRSVFTQPMVSITNCDQAGALGPVLGMLGSAQALEAIRILTSLEAIENELIYFDFKTYRVQRFTIPEKATVDISAPEPFPIDLSNEEFDQRRKEPHVVVVDVRQPEEKPLAPFSCLQIPMDELEEKVKEWNPSQEILFFCHSGIRSAHAIELLQGKGFTKVAHLRGGLIRYTISEKI